MADAHAVIEQPTVIVSGQAVGTCLCFLPDARCAMTMIRPIPVLATFRLLLIWMLTTSCTPSGGDLPSPAGASPKPANADPGKNLMDEQISLEFAVYYLPKPSKEPLAELELVLKETHSMFHRAEKLDKEAKRPHVVARINNNPQASYAPPSIESPQRFGRGLSREQGESVQRTKEVLILEFTYPKDRVWEGLRSATVLAHSVAVATGGLIWDEETREMFSPAKWDDKRLSDWTEAVPNISEHTVIHAYKKDEYVRAITLGMAKFGLPDVVVEGFSWELNRNMGHIVNMFAQAMAEGARVALPGDFDLDFKAIKNAKVREPQITTLKANATGVAALSLKNGTWEDGDPKNRLIEITFERGVGPDVHAKQEQILSAAFGAEDNVKAVKHDAELQAASERARTKLPALRTEFNNGLSPGEFIDVKAPFQRPDGGNEWMWVEVISWKGDKIRGLLRNEPYSIPTLHGGQEVEISESKVFDYLRRRPDGTSEGNDTGQLIEKKSK